MSAAIQVVNPLLAQPIQQEAREKPLDEGEAIELIEQKLASALDCLSRLQAEAGVLREKLLLTERSLALKDQLLHESLIREQTLRVELMKGLS
jgi:hypothetical protein